MPYVESSAENWVGALLKLLPSPRGVATGLEEKAKAEEAMAREHHQSRLLDSLLGKRSLRPLGLATAGLTRAAFADPTTTRRNRRASRARAPAEALT